MTMRAPANRKPRLRRLGPPAIRSLDLGARVAALPSELERGNAERATLYASPRWRAARRRYLRQHPACSTLACGQRSQVVDHASTGTRPKDGVSASEMKAAGLRATQGGRNPTPLTPQCGIEGGGRWGKMKTTPCNRVRPRHLFG
jgi:hypothetical protein